VLVDTQLATWFNQLPYEMPSDPIYRFYTYLYRRLLPDLAVRSATRQCVIASARWVVETILAIAWAWDTIAVIYVKVERRSGKGRKRVGSSASGLHATSAGHLVSQQL